MNSLAPTAVGQSVRSIIQGASRIIWVKLRIKGLIINKGLMVSLPFYFENLHNIMA